MKLTRIVSGAVVALGVLASTAAAQNTSLRKLDTENDARVWQAVGRLDAKGGGYCTGTLIAPDLVLTAAHCVYDRRGRLRAPDSMKFQAGLTNGKPAAERLVAQIEAHDGYTPNTPLTVENIRHDVALLRLEEAIPTHELDPFVVFSGTLSNGPVSVVSYGQGRSNALSRQNQCQVVGRQDAVIALDCDVTFGSSGAPVFSHLNGRGQIAAVISGGGTYAGERVAFGMSLPGVVSDLRRQMRANKPRPAAKVRRLGVGANKSSTGAKFVTVGGS